LQVKRRHQPTSAAPHRLAGSTGKVVVVAAAAAVVLVVMNGNAASYSANCCWRLKATLFISPG